MSHKEKDTIVPLGYWPTKVEPTIKVSELREWCEARRKIDLDELKNESRFIPETEQAEIVMHFITLGQVITKFCGKITDTGFCKEAAND